jgi:excinuclease ABC subunit C
LEEGDWKKSQYRRFKIKKAKGGDDYGGLMEVIHRRFLPDKNPELWPWPDLLLIDGGKGQLNAVLKAFEELGLKPPPTAGIAKDRTEGGPDRIFLPGRKNPADLKPGSGGLLILSKLRDEAHRYCRTYHHSLRSKEMLTSLFDGLKGLGPVRIKSLIKQYPLLEDLNKASDTDILKIAPISTETLKELRRKINLILNPDSESQN